MATNKSRRGDPAPGAPETGPLPERPCFLYTTATAPSFQENHTMSWRRAFVLLLALLCIPRFAMAQGATGTITGTVTSEDTKAPVVGVNVFVVGSSRASISGPDGRYVITGVAPGTRTVRATSIGYATNE